MAKKIVSVSEFANLAGSSGLTRIGATNSPKTLLGHFEGINPLDIDPKIKTLLLSGSHGISRPSETGVRQQFEQQFELARLDFLTHKNDIPALEPLAVKKNFEKPVKLLI